MKTNWNKNRDVKNNETVTFLKIVKLHMLKAFNVLFKFFNQFDEFLFIT